MISSARHRNLALSKFVQFSSRTAESKASETKTRAVNAFVKWRIWSRYWVDHFPFDLCIATCLPGREPRFDVARTGIASVGFVGCNCDASQSDTNSFDDFSSIGREIQLDVRSDWDSVRGVLLHIGYSFVANVRTGRRIRICMCAIALPVLDTLSCLLLYRPP